MTINAGDTTGQIAVPIIGDINDEANETIFVNLTNAVNATIAGDQGVITIDDDDGIGGSGSQISVDDVTVAEGNSGTAAMTFTVSRTLAGSGAATVDFATASGTAISGVDFTGTSGTLNFPLGVATQQVTVNVNGDRLAELDENLTLNLSSPSGATLLDAQGLGTITNDDNAPAADDQNVSTNEDVALPVTLGASDADGDPLTYSILSGPAHGVLTGSGADRTYTPAANYNGSDSFTFRASDGVNDSNIATVSVTVDPVNDPPVAGNLSRTLAEDSFETVTLPATDPEGDPLTYSIVDGPAHGVLSGSDANRTYTPDPNYNGPDAFTFRANDGTADSNLGTVSLTVTPVNDAPTAVNDSASVAEDGSVDLNVRSNDSDVDGDALNVIGLGTPLNGTAVILGNGDVRYTPNPNYNGSDVFAYTISDGAGGTASALVNVNVTPVNDAPVATDSSATVAQDVPETIPLHASDIDGDALSYSVVTGPAHGTLTGSDAQRVYTANPGYAGPDSFTFKANDGSLDSNVGTVSITVTATPTVSVGDVSVAEGNTGTTTATFAVTLNTPSDRQVTVDYATADGTATAPADYQAGSGTVTFAPGQTSQPVSVLVNGDLLNEADENFFVNLSNPVHGSLGDAQGTGTITNDDPLPALSISDVTVTEGDSGTVSATFTASLNASSGRQVTVDYATADGTAHRSRVTTSPGTAPSSSRPAKHRDP